MSSYNNRQEGLDNWTYANWKFIPTVERIVITWHVVLDTIIYSENCTNKVGFISKRMNYNFREKVDWVMSFMAPDFIIFMLTIVFMIFWNCFKMIVMKIFLNPWNVSEERSPWDTLHQPRKRSVSFLSRNINNCIVDSTVIWDTFDSIVDSVMLQ